MDADAMRLDVISSPATALWPIKPPVIPNGNISMYQFKKVQTVFAQKNPAIVGMRTTMNISNIGNYRLDTDLETY